MENSLLSYSSPLSRHRRPDEIDHPDHKPLAGASEQEMISAFDYDQTLRVAGRLVELAPLFDRDDRILCPMRDQRRAFHTGHFARRLEAVLRQEMQLSRQPWERDHAHVARRTQARFDDQRPAREA